ncbi:MAG: hypothetical protein KDD27_16270 [Saprospiraceae bacterium]|nr:hypothetical protein [Saprospiraceae bacterium]
MNCKQGTNIIIQQITDLLGKLDAEPYGRPLPLFNGSTIGQHFRHILDFYGCLARGVQEGRIDYAKRERDVLVESEPTHATSVFLHYQTAISSMDEAMQIEVVADFSADLNEERPVVFSTVGREMMYAYDHAVHHLAMIKMGLKVACPNVAADHRLGVAPSTLKHWKETGQY